jgi:hypothetical protein
MEQLARLGLKLPTESNWGQPTSDTMQIKNVSNVIVDQPQK